MLLQRRRATFITRQRDGQIVGVVKLKRQRRDDGGSSDLENAAKRIEEGAVRKFAYTSGITD